jgi:hypothetical protein
VYVRSDGNFLATNPFLPSRNGSRAGPESGIRTPTNGQSFTKYAQRALPRTLTMNARTEIFRFSENFRELGSANSQRRMMKERNT